MSEEVKRSQSRWKKIITLLTFIALGVLIYSLRKQIGDVVVNLGKVNLFWLLLILPLEFINYDVYTRLYKKLFSILGKEIGYGPLFKLQLELNFINHILPSGGVSGISYFGVRMRALGVSGTQATLAQVIKFFLLFVSFQPILILGLVLLAARGHVNNFIILIASSIITHY